MSDVAVVKPADAPFLRELATNQERFAESMGGDESGLGIRAAESATRLRALADALDTITRADVDTCMRAHHILFGGGESSHSQLAAKLSALIPPDAPAP